MAFRALIIGGTGQVGAAVVRALVAEPSCAEVVMVNRKAAPLTANPRLRQVILDTAAAQFPAEVTKLARSMVALGDPVYGASCVGVGKGSMTVERGGIEGPRNWGRRWFCPWLPCRRRCSVCAALGSGKHSEKQDSLCASHGAKRRNGSRDRLQTSGDFPPGNHRRQCSHAWLRCLVGASHSGTVWERSSRMISAALLLPNSSTARPPMASCISKTRR